MLMQREILERSGWSRALITRLLGDPDRREVRRAPQRYEVALYAEDRVVAAEASAEFASAQQALVARKASAVKAVETKVANLMAEVERMVVNVKVLPDDELTRCAVGSYNARQSNRRDGSYARPNSDEDFLARIKVNFIRHELTVYDAALETVAGKTGIEAAKDRIREKIFAAIANAYPGLAAECDWQCNERIARKWR